MAKIFVAFTGRPIKQKFRIFKIKDGYECWNLKKFTPNQFGALLRKKIPPAHGNVSRNYIIQSRNADGIFGLTPKEYSDSSWGLLIPDTLQDSISSMDSVESLFLMNLYSPDFLYPVFGASNFGIMLFKYNKPRMQYFHYQNQEKLFKSTRFVDFYKTLLPQAQYGTWQLYRCQNWSKEDWRLFVAALLYSGLEKYDNSKSTFTWQRESADMATILESLLTAGETQTEEVGYRLRKRIGALVSFYFPKVEEEIKELYSQRSSFVHGSFFSQIAKDSRRNRSNLPIPNFALLDKQKKYVRYCLIAYLYLAILIKSEQFLFRYDTVLKLLEDSIVDIKLRKKMLSYVRKIFSLMFSN